MTRMTPFFRFLDLPKEIRFIVYENLDLSKTQFRFDGTDNTNGSSLEQPFLVLTTQTLPVQLLATCRLIHSEAHLFLDPRLARLKQHIPKIRLDAEFLDTATYNAIANLLGMVLASLNHLQKTQERASLELQAQTITPPLHKDKILRKWILQTSTLLAFQAQNSTPPLLDFFADITLDYMRICLDVPKRWHSPSTHPPAQCTSSSAKLAELMSETLDSARKRGLGCIRSAAVIYAQEERGRTLDVRQLCAFEYGVKRK